MIAPENTMIAFTKAVQAGVKWMECDVLLAASGEPIILHDDQLDRTTNGFGRVDQYAYRYLQTLDAGGWFHSSFANERIPALIDVLNLIKEMQLSLNIELKTVSHPARLIEQVQQAIDTADLTAENQVLFSSFSIPTLYELRKRSTEANIGLLMDKWMPDWHELCLELTCCSVHVNVDCLTENRIKKIKDTGLLLLCYTVNHPLHAKTLLSLGVDALFSDNPHMLYWIE